MNAEPDLVDDPQLTRSNLDYLREESLTLIAFLAGIMGYLWLGANIWPVTGSHAPLSSWVGSAALVLGTLLSYSVKRRYLNLAAHGLTWSLLLATTCATLTFHIPAIEYIMTLPVILGGVLLSRRTIFVIALLASLIVIVGHISAAGGESDTPMPLVIIVMVTLASWLSSLSLRTTLSWFGSAYESASNNARMAREHEAELRRLVKVLDDMTMNLERANYTLTLERNHAEEARRLKQYFAQTISHELRTPLNLIVGFTELMAQNPEYYGGQLPAPYMRDLTIIHRNGRHLQTLVNDVLDLARMEAAQMSLIPENTDPSLLLQEAVTTGRSLVESRGLRLNMQIAPNLPQIRVDATRIRQVLFNLLNNAARFTEFGSITVSVWRDENEVIFSVVDTGIGIAQDDIPRLFKEFEQLDSSTRRRHGGAGLGLAISKRFVELHQGRIWVESQSGKGSAFYFALPIIQPDYPLPDVSDPAKMPADRAVLPPQHESILLVVTRSPSAATLLSRHVHGCRSVVVQNLAQAQSVAARLLPQVVFIDTSCEPQTPDSLQRLAQAWEMPDVPFIAYPVAGEDLVRQQLAVDGFLIKPISTQSLRSLFYQFDDIQDCILVIDDDHDFVHLLTRMLDRPTRHSQVINAYSGYEALELIVRYKPSLIFLDLQLPDIDSATLLEKIHALPFAKRTTIIAVSAQESIGISGTTVTPILLAQENGFVSGDLVSLIQLMLPR